MRRLNALGLTALICLAGASPAPADDDVKQVETISHGERVTIRRHLARGQYTLVYFYADW